jgi:hypothetical protein
LKHFAHSTKGHHFEKDKLGLLGSSLIFYFVAIDDWRLPMHAETIDILYRLDSASLFSKIQTKNIPAVTPI